MFDFIKVVGGQVNPKSTWERLYKEELGIVAKCDYAQFGKTKKTPVINVQGMVKLLFWLPGELAKQFFPNNNIFIQRRFAIILHQSKICQYQRNISCIKSKSGVINRKFKNI